MTTSIDMAVATLQEALVNLEARKACDLNELDALCAHPFSDEQVSQILNIFSRESLFALRSFLHESETLDEKKYAATHQIDLSEVKGFYAGIVRTETQLISEQIDLNNQENKAIFVGCGPMPLTAVYLNHFLGSSVVGIDYIEENARIGRDFIANNQLEKSISIQHADGASYDYSGADYIYLAAMSHHKKQILQRISETNPHALIVVRGATGLREIFYEKLPFDEFEQIGWHCLETDMPLSGLRNTSYILKYQEPSKAVL